VNQPAPSAPTQPAPRRIGFIGVGRMGGAMARRLLHAGHTVTVHDPRPEAAAACAEAGAHVAGSGEQAAAGRDVVFTSLPTPEQLRALYVGEAALTHRLTRGTVCVDVSTVDPDTARQVADRLALHGVEFVACPVGKGPAQAEEGAVPLFAGGPKEAVRRVAPVLEAIGGPLHHLGDIEAATMFKLISNQIGMANLAVLAEGQLLAERAGIPADAFEAALRDTGAHSAQVDMRLPSLARRDHHARFSVDLAAKDLRLAAEAAARRGLPTPIGSLALQQLLGAAAFGHGDEDVTAMIEHLAPGRADRK
jgi:3-hydroxyisobutyrate dehydrogenase